MTLTSVHMSMSDVFAARPFKWLESANPEGRPGKDGNPTSDDRALF